MNSIETRYCVNHPKVETGLSCGKCGKPICTKCMVHTSVGIRCRECLRLRVLPTYSVQPVHYLKAAATGLSIAAAAGILWAVLPEFAFWMALVMGFGVGEGVSWAANMKRGPGLQAVAAASVLFGVAISRIVAVVANTRMLETTFLRQFDVSLLSALKLDMMGLLFIALAFIIAIVRLR